MTETEKIILENQNILMACCLFIIQDIVINKNNMNTKEFALLEHFDEIILKQKEKIEKALT